MFGHNLWVECGRPRSVAIADECVGTRASYHYISSLMNAIL